MLPKDMETSWFGFLRHLQSKKPDTALHTVISTESLSGDNRDLFQQLQSLCTELSLSIAPTEWFHEDKDWKAADGRKKLDSALVKVNDSIVKIVKYTKIKGKKEISPLCKTFFIANFDLSSGFAVRDEMRVTECGTGCMQTSSEVLIYHVLSASPQGLRNRQEFCYSVEYRRIASEVCARLKKSCLDMNKTNLLEEHRSLDGLSMEHAVAVSGVYQDDFFVPYVQMRKHDIDLLEHSQCMRDDMIQALRERLLDKIPRPFEISIEDHQNEIEGFVQEYMSLLRARYYVSPVTSSGLTPDQMLSEPGVYSAALKDFYEFTESSAQLKMKLVELQSDRLAQAQELAKIPLWWSLLAKAVFYILFVGSIWFWYSIIYGQIVDRLLFTHWLWNGAALLFSVLVSMPLKGTVICWGEPEKLCLTKPATWTGSNFACDISSVHAQLDAWYSSSALNLGWEAALVLGMEDRDISCKSLLRMWSAPGCQEDERMYTVW